MNKYFSIDGYYKDDKSEFSGFIIKEFDDVESDEQADDRIFYYGLGEIEIQQAIADNGDDMLDFVITSYKEINF